MSSETRAPSRSMIGVKVNLVCPECGSNQVHLNFGQRDAMDTTGAPSRIAYLVCRACHYESVHVAQTDAFVLVGWDVVMNALARRSEYGSPEVKDTVLAKLGKMFGWRVGVREAGEDKETGP